MHNWTSPEMSGECASCNLQKDSSNNEGSGEEGVITSPRSVTVVPATVLWVGSRAPRMGHMEAP